MESLSVLLPKASQPFWPKNGPSVSADLQNLRFYGRAFRIWGSEAKRRGLGKKKFGVSGKNLIINVPVGTLVFDENKNLIEVVLIPSKTSQYTVCVSVQVGCAMSKNSACIHCATGTQNLVKNLSASEMVMQIMIAKRYLNDFGDQRLLKNIVLMLSLIHI